MDDEPEPLERDKKMAENLLSLQKNVLFLCGNIHASKQPIKLPFIYRFINNLLALIRLPHVQIPSTGIIRPCGSLLPPKDTIAYNIRAIYGGQYYNFKTKTLAPDTLLSKRVHGLRLPLILESHTDDYSFLYVISRITPSS